MKKVLIVDDDLKILEILQVSLRALDYEVFSAPNADSAIQQLTEHHFELVLLDINMPDVNGVELFKVVRERFKNVRILVSSVYPIEEQKRIVGNADGFYDKSNGFDDLDKAIINVLEMVDNVDSSLNCNVANENFKIQDDNVKQKFSLRSFFEKIKLRPKLAGIFILVLLIMVVFQLVYISKLLGRVNVLDTAINQMVNIQESSLYQTPSQAISFSTPFGNITTFEKMLSDILMPSSHSFFSSQIKRIQTPKMNVQDKDSYYEVFIDLPGVNKKSISIDLNENILTVNAKHNFNQASSKGTNKMIRVFSGGFKKSFRVPDDVDENKITASFKNDILKIKLYKKAQLKQYRKLVPVKVPVLQ